jgi:flagellum-specific peptidoglycan hydrolase FlgJ
MNLDTQIFNIAKNAGFTDISARLIVAQARLESANYTSNVFKNNNNMFGMKFLGKNRQPLANKGTLAPLSERTSACRINVNNCTNGDFYAKYDNPVDSVKDLINRLYNITRNGVTPEMLKNADSPELFANLLKKRNYFGSSEIDYAKGLKARLKKITILPIIGGGSINAISILVPLIFFLMYKYLKK